MGIRSRVGDVLRSPARHRVLLISLCAFAYLYVYPYFPNINNPNENVRFYMTAAMAEEGTYAIDNMRKRWGWVNDAAAFDGHIYSVKAPGTSLLGVPAYAAYRKLAPEFDRDQALWWCRVFGTILPALLFLYLFHRHLSELSRDPLLRDSVFIAVAVGSVIYGYGLLFVSHTTSAACAFVAYLLLRNGAREHAHPRARAFLSGLCSAGVTLFEYPGLMASVALSLLALWQWRSKWRLLLHFSLGALLPTLAMMHFQYHAFDNPFSPGHLYVESDGFRAAHHEGVYGAVGPTWEAFYGLLLSPGAGLLPLSPLLALSVPGAVIAYRSRNDRAALLCSVGMCVSTLLVIASMNNWRGGWTIGPRYLVLLIPFLALLALQALEQLGRSMPTVARALALTLTMLGIWSSGTLSVYYPHLPTRLNRPLAQLIPVLWEYDFAPYTAAGALGSFGSASMVPLGLCIGAMLLYACALRGGFRSLLLAIWPSALGVYLTFMHVETSIKAKNDVNLVTRSWTPAGHDFATRSRIDWYANDRAPAAEEVREVIRAYRAMHRGAEARALTRWLKACERQRATDGSG